MVNDGDACAADASNRTKGRGEEELEVSKGGSIQNAFQFELHEMETPRPHVIHARHARTHIHSTTSRILGIFNYDRHDASYTKSLLALSCPGKLIDTHVGIDIHLMITSYATVGGCKNLLALTMLHRKLRL